MGSGFLSEAQILGPIEKPELLMPFSDSNSKNETSILAIAKSVSALFSGVTALEYTVDENKPEDPIYTKLLWKETLEQYYFDFEVINRTGKNLGVHETHFFDGERSYVLTPQNNQVITVKGPSDRALASVLYSPLIPFQFLKKDGGKLMLSDISSPSKIMQMLEARTQIVGERKVNESPCLIVRVLDGFDKELHEPVDYEVSLSLLQKFYPIEWKAFDKSGALIKHFKVQEFPTGSAITYPLKASLWQSKWCGTITGPNGPVKYFGMKRELNFDRVTFNPQEVDLSLDVSIAEKIYDVDADTWISVPK